MKKSTKNIIDTVLVGVVLILAIPIVYLLWLQIPVTPPPLPSPIKAKENRLAGKIYLPILMYHQIRTPKNSNDLYSVSPEIFDKQMQWLKDNKYNVISYDHLLLGLKGLTDLPSNPVVISFDDGYRNQYSSALPILKKYDYPAIFFVYTNTIGKYNSLTWEMLTDMINSGMIIGSHSVSHPDLTKISEKRLIKELSNSKYILEQKLDTPITDFAYPYGIFSPTIAQTTQNAGYRSAATNNPDVYHLKNAQFFEIPRVYVNNDFDRFTQLMRIK